MRTLPAGRKSRFGTNFPQLGLKDYVDEVNTHLLAVKDGLRDTSVKDFMGGNVIRVLKLTLIELEEHGSKLWKVRILWIQEYYSVHVGRVVLRC